MKGESDVDNPLGASPDTALIVRNRVLLAGYLIVILYFMFFGFGRIERFDSYQFSLVLNGIPLWLPKHFSMDLLKIWFFALGNVVAFIPFGVLIPANLPASKKLFWKSAILFVAGIVFLELLQMASLLGSFDIADIIVNTLGFCIGYGSWKIAKTQDKRPVQAVLFCVLSIIFVLLAVIGAEAVNSFFK